MSASGPHHYGEAERLIGIHQDAMQGLVHDYDALHAQAAADHMLSPADRNPLDVQISIQRQRAIDGIAYILDQAQVHATLANTAAIALGHVCDCAEIDKAAGDWARAIDVLPAVTP